MKTTTYALLMFLMIQTASVAQEEEKKKEMPRLEIPEITIVGKKAITLPFARKGEVLDIELYEAPPPDSTVLTDRPAASIPVGGFPRFRETLMPWRAYFEGGAGSFSTVDLRGAVGYSDLLWEVSARADYGSTRGHTTNAQANLLTIGADASTMIETDNELLRRFRASGNFALTHETYGVFGIPDTAVDRTRNAFSLQTRIASAEQQRFDYEIGLGIQTMSIEDERIGIAGKTSVVSPKLSTRVGTEVDRLRFGVQFRYESSLLNYSFPTESPTFVELTPTAQWKFGEQWSVLAGVRYAHGAHSDAGSSDLLSPVAVVRWNPSGDFWASVWWEPVIKPASFFKNFQENAYLIPDMLLRHERKPVLVGIAGEYSIGVISFRGRVSYTQTDDTPIPIADRGGIRMEYASTQQMEIEVSSIIQATETERVLLLGTFHYARERENSVQLAMTPPVQFQARGELALPIPMTLWTSLNFVGQRNVDRQATTSLPGYMLLNAGASSTIIARTKFSLESENLLGTSYDWWSGYTAPGRRFAVRMQLTL